MKTQQATPILEYSQSRSYSGIRETETPEEPEAAPDRVTRLNEGVTRAVLSICLAAWAVIGLFLWIPRVLRAVVTFSVAIVQSTITETPAEAAGQKLRSAANFYRRGFVAAVEAIRPPVRDPRDPPSKGKPASEGVDASLLIRETVWSIVVWYVLLWVTGIIRGTPIDLATVEWAGLWSQWVEAVWSVPALFGM